MLVKKKFSQKYDPCTHIYTDTTASSSCTVFAFHTGQVHCFTLFILFLWSLLLLLTAHIPGQKEFVTGVSMVNLLPSNTLHYLTYEGSLTQPSCYENVNWIILNKPIYISHYDLNIIRNSINGYGDNFRPVQPIARRCIRTNIDFTASFSSSSSSSSTSSTSAADTKNSASESKLSGGKVCSTSRFATYKSLAKLSSSSPPSSSSSLVT